MASTLKLLAGAQRQSLVTVKIYAAETGKLVENAKVRVLEPEPAGHGMTTTHRGLVTLRVPRFTEVVLWATAPGRPWARACTLATRRRQTLEIWLSLDDENASGQLASIC